MIKGHRRSWKVMEGHGRSWKVKEGHGWYFLITRLTFQLSKVGGGSGGWGGGLSSGLCILDFGSGFGTWISDLDLGLDLGLTGLERSWS